VSIEDIRSETMLCRDCELAEIRSTLTSDDLNRELPDMCFT